MTRIETSTTTATMSDGIGKKSRKPTFCSVHKSSGKNIWQSKGRALFCLCYQEKFLLDQNNLRVSDRSPVTTEDPAKSLRFADQDVAVARIKILQQAGIDVTFKIVLLPYAYGGQ